MANRIDFDARTEQAVWQLGTPIDSYDSSVWRHDAFGQVMKRIEYGNRNSEHGWEIDHVKPLAQGGSNALSNLRPLNWRSNVQRGRT